MRGTHFDPRAMVTPNIWGYLWGKEAYGAMLFATALTNESIADALAMASVPADCTSRWRARFWPSPRPETFGPKRSTGSSPPHTSTRHLQVRRSDSLDALVAHNRRSAKSHSGIWRDLAVRKRPTEVDAQLGIVVTLGDQAGVPTPLTARLVTLVHEIERGERPQSLDTLDALARSANDERRTTND